MISGYSDHAANERTFLAWVRTGIAVIAFGFVIEKFNLFVFAIASSTSAEAAHRLQLDQLRLESLSGPLGRYDGLALMLGGLILIVIATARFVRTGRRLDDPETHPATSIRVELILSAVLVLLVVAFMTAAASTAPVFRQIKQNSMLPMHPWPDADKHDRAPCDLEPDGSRHKRIGFWRYPDSQVGPTSWVKAGTNRQIIH
jgi:inner membrane protein YidH